MQRAQTWFGLVALVGLVVIAFEVGERYPFARFHMFDHTTTAASRVIARTSDGEALELGALEAIHCDGEVELFTGPSADPSREAPRQCPVVSAYPEAERRVARYLEREHAAEPSGEPIEIVRRTFRFDEPWGEPAVDDCVIGRCTARRR